MNAMFDKSFEEIAKERDFIEAFFITHIKMVLEIQTKTI